MGDLTLSARADPRRWVYGRRLAAFSWASHEQTGNYRPSMSAKELRDEQIVDIGGLRDLQR